ncbi:sugar ABC transporter permease [Spirochaetia bacterium]|nr:sugar ABC transporter permease [Spirochaetia bacterium]
MKRLAMALLIMLIVGAQVFAGGGNDKGAAAGRPTEITVEVFDRGTDGGKSNPIDNNWTKWIQEKLLKDENIKVTFVPVPRSEEIPGLNNLMAAGTAPDICFTYTIDVVTGYAAQGGLFDMGPYTDTLLKDLNAFLGPDPALPGKDLIRRYEERGTGKLYSIPARRVDTASTITFMRKDWLDKLGLAPPKTTQEFYNALAAFKDKDPGNVGKNRVIPFAMMTSDSPAAGIITNSFIDPNVSRKDRWVNGNILLPGLKEGFRFLNKMYNEGLIDRDFPLYNNSADWYNLIKSGVVGSFTDLWQRPISQDNRVAALLKENIPGAEFIAIDPFQNAKGVTAKSSYDVTGVFFMIPKASKNPEAAMRYLNWLAKFENYNFLQIGPEGIVHDVVDGLPKVKPATGGWIQNVANNMDYTLPINGLDLGDADKNARVFIFSYPDASPEWIVNAHALAMKNASPDPFVPVTITSAQRYAQVLADKTKILVATSITASPANFDRVYDAAIADYLASGYQEIVNERKAKYIE